MATRWTALLIGCVLGVAGCQQPPASVAWHEATGGDFTLRSCGDRDATLSLAADLRETRATLRTFLPSLPERDQVPFSAYLFCRASDYVELAPYPGQANHFVLGLRGTRVDLGYETLSASTRTTARGTSVAVRERQLRTAVDLLQHHYIHHVIRAHADVPPWIEEGLAGLVGTTLREPTGVRRGRSSNGMRDLDGLEVQVPLGRVLRATDLRTWPEDDKIFFFRSAWLVMHYLSMGNIAAEEPPAPRLQRYIARDAAGDDEHAAALAAFGKGTVGLRNAVDRYLTAHPLLVRYGRVGLRADSTGGAGLAIGNVPTGEVARGFGVLALENGDGGAALRWFDAAVEAEPGNGASHSGRARALALQGAWGPASAALARADELAPDDPRVLLDGAAVLVARAATTGGGGARDQGRDRAQRVVAEAAYQAEAHYWLAESQEGAVRVEALERAHAASPGAIDIAFDYARALVEVGRIEDARVVATRVSGWVLGERRDRDVYTFLADLPEPRDVAAAP